MAVKFSAFTTRTGTLDASTRIVGYDDPAGTKTNVEFTLATLVANVPSIYDTDSSLTSNRTVTHNGYLLTWDLGNKSHIFNSSSGSGTWMNFRVGGSQKGALLAVSGGGGMYFRDSGGSDYYSLSQNGTMINTTVSIGAASFATETLEVNGNCKITGQGYTELHDTTNTTLTVDWNNSNIQELTSLTGSHTFTASNPKAGATYILTLAQTGAVTATWTGVKWPAATAPTLSGAGKTM